MTPYRTAAGYGEAEYEDKRSRFIGHIKPVTSENEAKAFIDEMRRTYADATHNVFAYVLREGTFSAGRTTASRAARPASRRSLCCRARG